MFKKTSLSMNTFIQQGHIKLNWQ